MKKVLVADDLRTLLEQQSTLLSRAEIGVLSAASNDEVLRLHRAERADLIITRPDLPGMPSEQLCSLIRADARLGTVALIMVCANTPAAIKECSRCRANAVLLQPVYPVLLTAKAQQLLNIPARQAIRVLLRTRVDTHGADGSFYSRTRDISATGMMIETDRQLAEGAVLTCQFYLPDAARIEATGRIVRIIQQTAGNEDHQYGLMFTNIASDTQQRLTAFVASASS